MTGSHVEASRPATQGAQTSSKTLVFRDGSLPESERASAFLIFGHSRYLGKFCEEVHAAVALIEHCEGLAGVGQTIADPWKLIAARDAILRIYHFCCSVDATRSIKSPVFKGMVDQKKISEASQKMRAKFPHYRKLRDAVGHSSDLIENPEKFRKNAVDGSFMYTGALKGREFWITIGGNHFSQRLDADLVASMIEIAKLIQTAIDASGLVCAEVQAASHGSGGS